MTTPQDPKKLKTPITLKEAIWESLGVFMLTFIAGYSSIVPSTNFSPNSIPPVGVTIANFGILFVFISLAGPESGAFFNPMVTLGFFLLEKRGKISTIYYTIVQLLASIFGGFCIYLLHGEGYDSSYGYPQLNPKVSVFKGFLFEFIATFILGFVVFYTAIKNFNIYFIAVLVPVTVAFLMNSLGPFTGVSMNPARTFGPALFDVGGGGGFFRRGWWIYYTATVIGGILGGALARFLAEGEDLKIEGGFEVGNLDVELVENLG